MTEYAHDFRNELKTEIEQLNAAKTLIDSAIRLKQNTIQQMDDGDDDIDGHKGTINNELRVARRMLIDAYEPDDRYYY